MLVRFRCFGPLRRAMGAKEIELEVPIDSTVRTVVDSVIEQNGDEVRRLILDSTRISGNLILMLNQKDVDTLDGENTCVSEGDTITMLPHVQGG